MMPLLPAALAALGVWLGSPAGDGLIQIRSNASAAETIARVEPALASRGLRLFVTVDHAANARGVGLELRPSTVFIFGNPRIGTRLMQCAPTSAIDLPVKLLVWQEADGAVWVGVNDPAWIAGRHGVGECGGVIETMRQVLRGLAAEVAGQPAG